MAKQKKLKKAWRKLRHAVTHRTAICQGKQVTLLSEYAIEWWVSNDPEWEPPDWHISQINLHDPDVVVGVYIEGPIRKGIKKSSRAFIDLCNETAWSLIDEKGKILLHKEIHLKALHPGIIDPIMRNANRKLEELV